MLWNAIIAIGRFVAKRLEESAFVSLVASVRN